MTTEVTRKPSYNPPIAFRTPDVTKDQLDQLQKIWGTNCSQAIIRCIERVWVMEIGYEREKENSSQEIA